jgi:hypothetical protein
METDWLSIRCRYASLCASILKEFYGQSSLQKQNPNSISNLEDQLHSWVRSLPAELQSIESQGFDLAVMNSLERRGKLRVFFQYHEALLAIHTRRRSQQSLLTPIFDLWLLDSEQRRASSVRKILAVGGQLKVSDVRSDP